jgi:uncharacterized protein (DUF924 family)
MISIAPETVTDFWLTEVGEDGWYNGGAALDAEIRRRFEPAWTIARAGGLEHWRTTSARTLAYLVLTDQFPRNMFRDDARAFATDGMARAAAKQALLRGWDLDRPEIERQFFYLPLIHSEVAEDQDRAVRLVLTRMPGVGLDNLLHARAHREVIRRFGRFPTRNAALNRDSTAAERAFLETGGYGAVVRALQG